MIDTKLSLGNSLSLEKNLPLFQLDFDDRNLRQNEAIGQLLREYFPLKPDFSEFKNPKESFIRFLRLFKYEVYHQGQAIFHHGDIPNKFWMIISGEAWRYVPKLDNGTIGSILESQLSPLKDFKSQTLMLPELRSLTKEIGIKTLRIKPFDHSKSVMTLPTEDLTVSRLDKDISDEGKIRNAVKLSPNRESEDIEIFKNFDMPDKYQINKNSMNFQMDRIFRQSESFADLLCEPSEPYPSTLIARDSSVHMIYIPMEKYNIDFKQYDQILIEKTRFVRQLFNQLPEKALQALIGAFNRKIIQVRESIFNEDSECDEILFVQKGSVEITKNVDVNSKIHPEVNSLQRSHAKRYQAPISILSEGMSFGEEMVLDKEKRIFNAKTRGIETVLYHISKTSLLELTNKHETIYPAFISKAQIDMKEKMLRLSRTLNSSSIAISLFQEPTDKEKTKKAVIMNSFDQLVRDILQDKLKKAEPASIYVASESHKYPQKLDHDASLELKRLADTKVKTIRKPVKMDAIDESEQKGSPLLPNTQQHRKNHSAYLSHITTTQDMLSPKKDHITPTSLWSRAMQASGLEKRLKMQAIRENKIPVDLHQLPEELGPKSRKSQISQVDGGEERSAHDDKHHDILNSVVSQKLKVKRNKEKSPDMYLFNIEQILDTRANARENFNKRNLSEDVSLRKMTTEVSMLKIISSPSNKIEGSKENLPIVRRKIQLKHLNTCKAFCQKNSDCDQFNLQSDQEVLSPLGNGQESQKKVVALLEKFAKSSGISQNTDKIDKKHMRHERRKNNQSCQPKTVEDEFINDKSEDRPSEEEIKDMYSNALKIGSYQTLRQAQHEKNLTSATSPHNKSMEINISNPHDEPSEKQDKGSKKPEKKIIKSKHNMFRMITMNLGIPGIK